MKSSLFYPYMNRVKMKIISCFLYQKVFRYDDFLSFHDPINFTSILPAITQVVEKPLSDRWSVVALAIPKSITLGTGTPS